MENKFDRRRKISNEVMLPPVDAGMFPENLLWARSRLARELQFCKEDGSSPERLLLLTMKNMREESKLTSLGIGPERLLFDMSENVQQGQVTPEPRYFS